MVDRIGKHPGYQNCHDYVTSHLHPNFSQYANWPCLQLADGRTLGPWDREKLRGYNIQDQHGTNETIGQFNRRLIDNDFPQQKPETQPNLRPDP